MQEAEVVRMTHEQAEKDEAKLASALITKEEELKKVRTASTLCFPCAWLTNTCLRL